MLDAGYWFLDSGYKIPDAGCRIPDTRCRILMNLFQKTNHIFNLLGIFLVGFICDANFVFQIFY